MTHRLFKCIAAYSTSGLPIYEVDGYRRWDWQVQPGDVLLCLGDDPAATANCAQAGTVVLWKGRRVVVYNLLNSECYECIE